MRYRGRKKDQPHTEFECPVCNAPCPYPDGIENGDEVSCYYCRAGFRAEIDEENRLKLKEL
jgi:transcription elongation factor Elf1